MLNIKIDFRSRKQSKHLKSLILEKGQLKQYKEMLNMLIRLMMTRIINVERLEYELQGNFIISIDY
jgi:hypothetical protein